MSSATFPAELRSLREIRKFLRKSSRAAEFSPGDLDRLDLVIEEIAVNVCRYAYPATEARPLRIDCHVRGPGDIFVCIADTGVPFDPRANPAPDLGEMKRRPVGGLGIFLVSHLAREILYERNDGWNRLSFRFSSNQFSSNPGPPK